MAVTSRSKSLKKGRPPLTTRRALSADSKTISNVNPRKKSAKATRTLISRHHQLQKSKAAALSISDLATAAKIDAEVEQLGGLEAYQAASLTGQDKDRGGDSSEKLVEWLRKHDLVGKQRQNNALRVLEVGALSSKNAISSMIGHGIELVKRIDLHSQEPDMIEEIDFMTFPIPKTKFDLLSLSLVLNFVSANVQRGEMLRRTTQFLRHTALGDLPMLFLVLPLSCLKNSRYMTQKTLEGLMAQLGYSLLENHHSTKLAYMLFKLEARNWDELRRESFKKTIVNDGRSRNNFSIMLEAR